MVINKTQKLILVSIVVLLLLTVFYFSFNGSIVANRVSHLSVKTSLSEKVAEINESEFHEMKKQIAQLNRIVQKNSEIMLHLAKLSSTNAKFAETDIDDNALLEQQLLETVSSNETIAKKLKTKEEFVNDTYAKISDFIVSSGESPQKVTVLNTAIDNIKNIQSGNAKEIIFNEGNCSESRCIVQADVANSPFQLDKLNADLTFKASDDYARLIAEMSEEVSNSFGEKTDVSYYRSGDRLVMDVKIRSSNKKQDNDG